MRIHLVATTAPSQRTRAIRLLATAMREAGADVVLDVDATPERLAQQWHDSGPADIVHAIGVAAASVAIRAVDMRHARAPVPAPALVVGLDEPRPDAAREGWVAQRADALVVASGSERRVWRRALPALAVHVAPLPTPVPDRDAVAPADGRLVVSDATGPVRHTLLQAADAWPDTRVAFVDAHADGAESSTASVLRLASVVVATQPARGGGLAAMAAGVGVPAVVLGPETVADAVVDGATGIVLGPRADAATLSAVVGRLLGNPVLCRGFGLAAQLRQRATSSPEIVAQQCLAAYRSVLAERRAASASASAAGTVVGAASAGADAGLVDSAGARAAAGARAEAHLDLAAHLARRYDGRGQSLEDLVQVANLGLAEAAQRFDPARGSSFPAFAVPTIVGELRRYFREQSWSVRVPRRVQEDAQEVAAATQDLACDRGRQPSVDAVAEHTGLGRQAVRRAQQARAEALSHASLDRPVDDADGVGSIGVRDTLGEPDGALLLAEARADAASRLASLPERDREILTLRYFGEHTQPQIAERLGVSQAHVSRTLRRTLEHLRGDEVS